MMTIHFRHGVLGLFLSAAALAVMPAQAQDFPTRPVRLIIGVTPGGILDILARSTCQHLGPKLGQPCIVDSRPGGSGAIATLAVTRSAPDGHTLYLMGSSQSMVEAGALSIGKQPPFDTLKGLTGISLLVENPYVLAVHPNLPVKTARDFVALARSKPGWIAYGSSGVGKTDHVAAELLASRTGIKMLHVPYTGLGPQLVALLPGEIQAVFTALAPLMPHIQSGKLRALGLVSESRTALMPELPTLAEAVPLQGYKVSAWIGLMAPKDTPRPVVDRLNSEVVQMVKNEGYVQQVLRPRGLDPVGSSPDQLTSTIRAELELYTKVFKDAKIILE